MALKRNSRGFTLLELMLVLGLVAALAITELQRQSNRLEQAQARQLGVQIYRYNNAVRNWLAHNLGATASQSGTGWLKESACGGTADRAYLPCDFPDELSPGDLPLSTSITTVGDITRARTTLPPLKIGGRIRPDLAGLAALTASGGAINDLLPTMATTDGSFTSDPQTAVITMEASNTATDDAWLRTDGSNSMHNTLKFDSDVDERRNILGVNRIASVANSVLMLGDAAIGSDVVIGADAEILGHLVARRNVEVHGSIDASGDIRSESDITARGSMVSGADVRADRDVHAGGTIRAQEDVLAGGDLRSERNVYADADIFAEGEVVSEGNIRAGHDLYVSNRIESAMGIESGRHIYAADSIVAQGSLIARDGDIIARSDDVRVEMGNLLVDRGTVSIKSGNVNVDRGDVYVDQGGISVGRGNINLDYGDLEVDSGRIVTRDLIVSNDLNAPVIGDLRRRLENIERALQAMVSRP